MNSLTDNDIALEVSQLSKRFENLTAVNDISFCIRQHEIFGLLGPNGAGKTTTISMVCGYLFTRTATEVLVVGNFLMFLFMFFTGAAFPLPSNPLFSISGYPISLQGLMTPTHAISVLNKTLILNSSFSEIIPELIAILVLTALYFTIGAVLFKRRHLKLTV